MLTRALFLATVWLILSFVPTMARGARLRYGSTKRSLTWFAAVLLAGDLWAMLTFGIPHEIALLTGITFIFGFWWIKRLSDWNALGQTTWIITLVATFLYIAYTFASTVFTPLHPLAFLIALILFFIEFAALVLAITYAYETLDVGCRIRWNRYLDDPPAESRYFPKVSLHVPAYNEPPNVVEATLRALAQLDYPDFEVLLIDNNTLEESTWRPIEALCRDLGPPLSLFAS